ncbi:histone-like nucleoid-structuring protein Lsr2 [Streptomyces sp. NPDC013172]|uniref:Histone-like nucleoid-structuring protein Lsr2 n=1 Tax=Streptomyces atriruber TaxID=545121 RepID=A0ABV3C0Y3_9ACTN
MAGQIWRAKPGSVLSWEGRTLTLGEDVYAREGHPILDAYQQEFEPVFVTFEVDNDAGPAEPEPAPAEQGTADEQTKPEPKAVRAWAAENGIDVPARGKIPDTVYEQYAAAQE